MKRLIAIREEIEDLTNDIIKFAENLIKESDEINLEDYIEEDEEPAGYNYKTDSIIWKSYYYFDYDHCNEDAYYIVLKNDFITDEDIQTFNKEYNSNITKEEFLEILKNNDGLFEPYDDNSYKWPIY